ncbi:MAG: hypothetical protein AB1542_15700, partial [Pseudomonadota bacterium]
MGASAAVLSAFAVPAFAQQQTAQQGGTVIEELVVTAQKSDCLDGQALAIAFRASLALALRRTRSFRATAILMASLGFPA